MAGHSKDMAYFCKLPTSEAEKTAHFSCGIAKSFGKDLRRLSTAKAYERKKVLCSPLKPAVQSAWEEDLRTHVDFAGWQFIKPGGAITWETADKQKPIVCFGSFQDYLGRNPSTGGIKTKNEWVHATNWDCVIFDEYHYGAWREKAKDLFEAEDDKERKAAEVMAWITSKKKFLPITAYHYLYLSGTPFRAIASGSLSRSRSTTGPTPMSSGLKKIE
jgi:hypothetical protein